MSFRAPQARGISSRPRVCMRCIKWPTRYWASASRRVSISYRIFLHRHVSSHWPWYWERKSVWSRAASYCSEVWFVGSRLSAFVVWDFQVSWFGITAQRDQICCAPWLCNRDFRSQCRAHYKEPKWSISCTLFWWTFWNSLFYFDLEFEIHLIGSLPCRNMC